MNGWIALHRSEEAEELQAKHPNAFLLLTQIARRARWRDSPVTGLKVGEALIGDWKKAGIPTQMAYRTAKNVLTRCHFATFRGTTRGTIATLASSSIFSISVSENNERKNDQTANRQRAENDQATTNEQGYKDTPITKKQSTREPKLSDPEFIALLKSNSAYSGLCIDTEIQKMHAWLLTQPGRRLTRPFIVKWLNRCDKPVKVDSPANGQPIRRSNHHNSYNETCAID